MTNLTDLTTSQLHHIIAIKEQIKTLQSQVAFIAAGDGEIPPQLNVEAPKKHRRSAATRAQMAAAARKCWARVKGNPKSKPKPAKKGNTRLSAAGRAAIIAAAKARWGKVKGRKATPKAAKKKDRRSSPAVRAKKDSKTVSSPWFIPGAFWRRPRPIPGSNSK
jgi:hypothetical protein